MIPKECKRLAEVDFPIAMVSKYSAIEKSIRHGHPSTLHLWWARRPLAACRAMLLAQGIPLRSIMEVLGHSSISVTADIYSHIAPALMRDAAAGMDAMFGGKARKNSRCTVAAVQTARRARVVSIRRPTGKSELSGSEPTLGSPAVVPATSNG
jgi:hypothetical protein